MAEKKDSAAKRYEVIKHHGEGVLFTVYHVRERSTLDIYALKALHQSYAAHSAFQSAWKNVARAALHRNARHIARVHEIGLEDNTPYLVEEWLGGHTLEERLRRAPFGNIEATILVRHMAEGLTELHKNNETHGDFRPRQVLFDAQSKLRINDVGWGNAVRHIGLSIVDVFPDAAYYLAPELWDKPTPTPASDIYALGITLYRMLAARVPFAGNSPLIMARQHQRTAPTSPMRFNSACAPILADITLGLLDKDPTQRSSAFEQLASLRQEQLSTRATPTRPASMPPSPSTPMPVTEQTMPPAKPPQREKRNKRQKPKTRKELGKRELKSAFLAFFWAIIAVGLLAGIIMGAMYFWMQGAPPEVHVPNYVGMNQTDAENALGQHGLSMEVVREVYDPKRATGTVLSGQPQPDTMVRSGRTIMVTVSRGKEPIRMYDFRGLTLDQTKKIMQKHGLRIGQISNQYDDVIPKNSVITQFPSPGQYFHRYDPISLVISRGPGTHSNRANDATDAQATDVTPPSQDTTGEINTGNDDNSDDNDAENVPSSDDDAENLTSRAVQVNVEIPKGSAAQLVTIVINDATGEHTVYSKIRQPGETVNQTVQVAKTPSSSATVQVYAGGQLLREMNL